MLKSKVTYAVRRASCHSAVAGICSMLMSGITINGQVRDGAVERSPEASYKRIFTMSPSPDPTSRYLQVGAMYSLRRLFARLYSSTLGSAVP